MTRAMAVQVTIYLNEADQFHRRPLHLGILTYLREQGVYAATATRRPLPVPVEVDPPVAPRSVWRCNFLSALFELVELDVPVPPELFDVVVLFCRSNLLSALFGLPLELPEPVPPLWPDPLPEPVPEPVFLVLAGFGVAAGCA